MVNSTLGYVANLNGQALIVPMTRTSLASIPLHLPYLVSTFNPSVYFEWHDGVRSS